MADNRMFLVHRESGLGVMLGKRLMIPWSANISNDELNRFYNYIANNYDKWDDFMLIMEDCSMSGCFDDWRYTDEFENGFRRFEIMS